MTEREEPEVESPELQELALRLQEVELETKALELDSARALQAMDRELKRAQLQGQRLDNERKHDELRAADRRQLWQRAGTVVAWIAALVPLYYSAWQLFEQQKQARAEDRRVRIQAAATRFGGGPASGAFELALWPEGIPILVGGVQGTVDSDEEAELSLAALAALERLEEDLSAEQRTYLESERDNGVERLIELAEPYHAGDSTDEDDDAFLRCFEVNRRLRKILGDGDRWNDNASYIQFAHGRLHPSGEAEAPPPAPVPAS